MHSSSQSYVNLLDISAEVRLLPLQVIRELLLPSRLHPLCGTLGEYQLDIIPSELGSIVLFEICEDEVWVHVAAVAVVCFVLDVSYPRVMTNILSRFAVQNNRSPSPVRDNEDSILSLHSRAQTLSNTLRQIENYIGQFENKSDIESVEQHARLDVVAAVLAFESECCSAALVF